MCRGIQAQKCQLSCPGSAAVLSHGVPCLGHVPFPCCNVYNSTRSYQQHGFFFFLIFFNV